MKKSRILILLGGLCLILAYILFKEREDTRALKVISREEAKRQESLELFLLRGSELPSDITHAWQERLTQLSSIYSNEKGRHYRRIALHLIALNGMILVIAFRRRLGTKFGDKTCKRNIG
ncbi:hypothetical protein [Entomospira culicis]|uniref:Uncharacterized protein n=1 Tax=Entomospira culicis TaxID=2719989 RepID=A0A968GFL8_9SPIO|nr:hypothetical protein [Entomospira culicis]NIZ19188.1 hypothetical protein [Entomospira culicis]NIZ69402.1 hypothetical protein [Entomospira culicis]WDI36519.1 hypothetical protein PVA46_04130 [Entomospira culicis]WDI38145.1 hypothetical protein PVA47_04130 [Entomospira culicis]